MKLVARLRFSQARDAPLTAVAFEVDAADTSGAWGWIRLVQGPAFDSTDALAARSRRLRQLPVQPWAPGARDHWLTVTAVRLSDRAFGVVPE